MKRWNRRLVSEIERISSRCGDLSLDPNALDDTIHQARRISKNLRSLVKLIAPLPTSSTYSIVERLREISRTLSPYRDQVVFVETVGRIRDRLQSKRPKMALELTRVLTEQAAHNSPSSNANASSDLVRRSLADLRAAASDLQEKLRSGEVIVCSKDIFRNHLLAWKKMRRRYRRICSDSPAEAWHDLRKAAKCLEYQLKLLRNFSLVNLNSEYRCMEEVGSHLGLFNDLAKANEFFANGRSALGIVISIDDSERDGFLSIADKISRRTRRDAKKALKHVVAGSKRLGRMKYSDVIF